MDCRTIYGQKDWEDCCWNMVKVDDDYYHVDLKACQEQSYEAAFFCSDTDFWGVYRWNIAVYPKCSGPLRYSDLIQEPETEEEDLIQEQVTEEGLSEDSEAVFA